MTTIKEIIEQTKTALEKQIGLLDKGNLETCNAIEALLHVLCECTELKNKLN